MNNFVIRHRKIINLQMLTILLAMVLGGLQVADGQEAHMNWVKITEPIENRPIHDSVIDVSGECDIRDGSNIWVLYRWRGPDSSWMFKRATECQDGHWKMGPINLHNQIGSIDIIATTFGGKMGGEEIQRFLTGLNTDKLPPRFKGETSDRATVTVRKK